MGILGILLVFIGLALPGCTPKAIQNTVYQEGKNLVRLESRPHDLRTGSEDQFEHPLIITEEELARVIQSIRVEEKRGFFSLFKKTNLTSVPAFSQEEAQRMGGPLATALARAQPTERVSFLFTLPRGRFLSDISSGVIFVKGDRLHLILGRYRAASRPHEKDISLGDPALPSPPYYGFRLRPGPNQALVDADESPWKEPTGIQHWVMIDYRQILAQPPEQEPFPLLKEEKATTEPSKESDDLKEKLRLLKELRDEDLITEEEYEIKRKETLKQF